MSAGADHTRVYELSNMETSLTLLQSIKKSGDRESWELLNELYSPLIRRWLKKCDIRLADEDDLLQEVFLTVVEKISTFERGEHEGSFRSWLKKISVNCFRNYYRKKSNRNQAAGGSDIDLFIQQLEDPESSLSQVWNDEHQRSVFQYLVKVVRPKFSEETWQAFHDTSVLGRPTKDVAEEIGTTVGAIHTAKSRVLAELRRLGQGLLEVE